MVTQDNLLKSLVALGKVTEEQVRIRAFGKNSAQVVKEFFSKREISEDDLLEAAVHSAGGDHSVLEKLKMVVATDLTLDSEALMLIPGDFARRKSILPYKHDEGSITVVIPFSSASDVELRDSIKRLTRAQDIKILHSSTGELKRAIENAYRAEGELREIAQERAAEEAEAASTKAATIETIKEESAASRFVNLILEQAITDNASDIHLEQTERNVLVRFRIDGVLHDISENTPKSMANEIMTRIKILSDLDIAERRKPQDGRLRYRHSVRGNMDFRIAILPTVNGEKVIMRILDNSQASLNLTELGFHPSNLSRFEEAYRKPYGMVLVTGPTGSGKSTTLYATLNAITNPGINIITVEDPVEYKVPRINQVQVNPKAGLTFATALRSILRADPDVILIGEIRDRETAHIAVEAAQTGHLVLSTLHTNDAPSAVERIVDLGIEPFLVGNVVEAILAQRLVRRLCKECKQPYTPEPHDLLALDFPWKEGDPLPTLYEPHPDGCKSCSKTGYRGRMAIHEVLRMSPNIEKIIVRDGTSLEIAEQAQKEGMHTLRQDGWYNVLAGGTSISEILRVVA